MSDHTPATPNDHVVENPATNSAPLTSRMVLLFAVSCGISAANLYYAQPLLPSIAKSFGVSSGAASLVVTGGQVGYVIGLALIVPLGDMLVRRRLIPGILVLAAAGLFTASAAPDVTVLIAAMSVTGICSVAAQILVPFAAHLADEPSRGRVVGAVVSGLLMGILLARTFSGLIAQVAGWRAVYVVAGVLILSLAVLLNRALPGEDQRPQLVYRHLLESVVELMRSEPLLRLRSLLGALVFAAFNVLWTSLAFLLAKPPYGYDEAIIGLFGLLGAGGAFAASFSGRLADRGHERLVTGTGLALVVAAFGLLALGSSQLWALVMGILLADLGIQAVHVQNQQLIFGIDPESRSRLNTGYMVSYFIGGASGSATAGIAYARGGWLAVAELGIAYGAAALVVWLLAQVTKAGSGPRPEVERPTARS